MYGGLDKTVSRDETTAIYTHLNGEKTLKVFETAKHENLLTHNTTEWIAAVEAFLNK